MFHVSRVSKEPYILYCVAHTGLMWFCSCPLQVGGSCENWFVDACTYVYTWILREHACVPLGSRVSAAWKFQNIIFLQYTTALCTCMLLILRHVRSDAVLSLFAQSNDVFPHVHIHDGRTRIWK